MESKVVFFLNSHLPFFLKKYLFIWLHWVLVAAWEIFIAACGIARCSAQVSLVVACGLLFSCAQAWLPLCMWGLSALTRDRT